MNVDSYETKRERERLRELKNKIEGNVSFYLSRAISFFFLAVQHLF